MNRMEWSGKWQQIKGKLRERWGKLTDDDLEVIAGRREALVGKLREVYGLGKAEVEQQVAEMEKSCGCGSAESHEKHFEKTRN